MDHAESAKAGLENHWLVGQSRSRGRYSDAPSSETKVAYVGVLKPFADLVLRGEAPEAKASGLAL